VAKQGTSTVFIRGVPENSSQKGLEFSGTQLDEKLFCCKHSLKLILKNLLKSILHFTKENLNKSKNYLSRYNSPSLFVKTKKFKCGSLNVYFILLTDSYL